MAGNSIDPRATIVGDVRFGVGNVVEAGALLVGPLIVGDGNFFGPNCVVGTPPQVDDVAEELRRHGVRAGSEGGVRIGDGNVVREFVAIQRGLTGDTLVGDGCYLMAYSNVQHDCTVGDGVKLANSVQMGGYTWLGRGAYVGLSAVIHQFTTIGAFSMVGMGSVVTLRQVPPGSLLHGNPARLVRANTVGLERIGVRDIGWWAALSAGSDEVEVPVALESDLAEFRRAVAAAGSNRTAVDAWRARRRKGSGGAP